MLAFGGLCVGCWYVWLAAACVDKTIVSVLCFDLARMASPLSASRAIKVTRVL